MAKITIGADMKLPKPKLKQGDLVTLMDGKNHNDKYRNRPMIVSKDESVDGYFSAFCLVDSEELTRCAASQFDLCTKHILLSN